MSEAHLNPDGSCELYEEFEQRSEAVWPSMRAWADTWHHEWRTGTHGAASDFAYALIYESVPGVVGALVALTDAAAGDPDQLSLVGAGPLEDLILQASDDSLLLEEIVTAARQHPAFRRALTGVWLGQDLSEPVRRRLAVLGARDFVAEHAMSDADLAAYFADRRARGWLGQGEDA